MKLSNKILIGGFSLPVVLVVLFVLFMSANSTDVSADKFETVIENENIVSL